MKNELNTAISAPQTLQNICEPGTMETVTQSNAVKSSNQGPQQPVKEPCVYTVEEVAQMLAISLRSAYNLCASTNDFRVLHVGGSIRIPRDSFNAWLFRAN